MRYRFPHTTKNKIKGLDIIMESHKINSLTRESKRPSQKPRHIYYFQFQNCRRMMGEGLSGLTIKDLQNLESQLQVSLHAVLMKKV